jgi:hypothetical protein
MRRTLVKRRPSWYWSPAERVFWRSIVQFDVDANGNEIRGDARGQNLTRIGVLHDATLLFNKLHRLRIGVAATA